MGKTPKPLTILVDRRIEAWEEIQALKAQGHDVWTLGAIGYENAQDVDLILGPTCHRMSEHERPWLDDAIAEARRLKYFPKDPKNAA